MEECDENKTVSVHLQRLSGFVQFVSVSSSDAGCLPSSALRTDSQPALCGITRVGLVAKGLLIKGDMDLELVLMCREKPTKTLLYTVSANLPLQIQVTFKVAAAVAMYRTTLHCVVHSEHKSMRKQHCESLSRTAFVLRTLVHRERQQLSLFQRGSWVTLEK